MATTTVAQHQPSASRRARKSGFFGLRRSTRPVAPQIEHDGAPHPEADTTLLPKAREPRRSHGAHALGNIQPLPVRTQRTDPDDIAANMIVKLGRALQPGNGHSSTALLASLDADIVELHKRSNRELELGRTQARREQRAQDAAAAGAATIEAQVALEALTGVPAQIDTAALGSRIARLSADAHAPEDPTTTFPRITDDMPDPRETPAVEVTTVTALTNGTAVDVSPLHRADGVAPAIPAEEPEDADPGDRSLTDCAPLPHRPHRTDSFPARLDEHGEPVDGGQVDAMDVKAGTWLLHWGRWCLIAAAEVRGDQMHIRLASGVMDDPHISASVRVLGAEAASTLLAETEAQYTEVTR